MRKVETNQSKRSKVIAEKQGLTGSEIHSRSISHIPRRRCWPRNGVPSDEELEAELVTMQVYKHLLFIVPKCLEKDIANRFTIWTKLIAVVLVNNRIAGIS